MSDRTKPPTNIFERRVTLIANICALLLACVIAAEVVYVEYADLRYVVPGDVMLCLFPAAVMFVIKSEPFSFVFLLAHLVISIRLFLVVRGISTESFNFTNGNDPLFILVLFGAATVICLAIYVLVALIKFIVSHLSSENLDRP